MIEEKLEEARLRNARKRMQIVIALLATACLVGLVIFGLSLVDFSSKDKSQIGSEKKTNVSEDSKEQIRNEFKESLLEYENELEPRFDAVGAENWNRNGVFEITELKKEMMLNFGNGEYEQALENLQTIKDSTVAILAEAERLYSENIQKAAAFMEEDLYDAAKLHIDKALVVSPQAPEALALQKEIEKLPFILPLLKGAETARAENNIEKEYDFLQQIVEIAPQRREVADRLEELEELIVKQAFEDHLSAGFAAIEQRKVNEAQSHYLEARKIDHERMELTLLSSRIASLERSLRIQKYIKQAEQAVRRDDWREAQANFSKAAQDAPENKVVVEGLRQSGLVLNLLESFEQYLKNPYRLANSGVRREAEKVLVEAEAGSRLSFTVKEQAQQLEELIDKLNRLIPVTIVSDTKTFVQVRGVGKVGAVAEKIIQLKPGNYTFEGMRTGFKSKLVQAFIPYDQDKFIVHIVCDEQI